jgi:tyrosine decarboxylase/aspartate 1-decarboxylase
MLEASRDAAVQFAERLASDARWLFPFAPELDIVVWAPRAKTIAEISALSQQIFDAAAKQNLHLALIRVPLRFFAAQHNLTGAPEDAVLCLRSVLMKPEHRDWLGRIWKILSRAADEVPPFPSPDR